jgi:hypothetical protein
MAPPFTYLLRAGGQYQRTQPPDVQRQKMDPELLNRKSM